MAGCRGTVKLMEMNSNGCFPGSLKPKCLLEDFLFEEHFLHENHLYLSSLFPPPEIWRYSGLLKTIGFPKAGSYTLLSEGTLAGGRLTSRDSCLTEDF